VQLRLYLHLHLGSWFPSKYIQLPIVAREIRIPHGRLFKLDLFHFFIFQSNHESFIPPSPARLTSCLKVRTKVLGALTEPGAGFLPFALCAPHLSVLHPVHLPALLGVSSRPSQGRLGAGAVGLGRQSDVLARRLLTGRDDVEGGDGDCDGHGVHCGVAGRHGRAGPGHGALLAGPLQGRAARDDGGYGGAGGGQDGSPPVLGVLMGRPGHVLVVRDDEGLGAGRHHRAGAA